MAWVRGAGLCGPIQMEVQDPKIRDREQIRSAGLWAEGGLG